MHTNPPDDVRALYERYRTAVPVEAADDADRLAHVPELIRFLRADGSPAAAEMLTRLRVRLERTGRHDPLLGPE